jgi:hypothetical protein
MYLYLDPKFVWIELYVVCLNDMLIYLILEGVNLIYLSALFSSIVTFSDSVNVIPSNEVFTLVILA